MKQHRKFNLSASDLRVAVDEYLQKRECLSGITIYGGMIAVKFTYDHNLTEPITGAVVEVVGGSYSD